MAAAEFGGSAAHTFIESHLDRRAGDQRTTALCC